MTLSYHTKSIVLSMLLPMSAWAIHLFGIYVSAEWICLEQPNGITISGRSLLTVISIVAFIVCILSLFVTFNLYQRSKRLQAQTSREPSRYKLDSFVLSCTGLMTAFLLVAIVIQSLPILLVPIC